MSRVLLTLVLGLTLTGCGQGVQPMAALAPGRQQSFEFRVALDDVFFETVRTRLSEKAGTHGRATR